MSRQIFFSLIASLFLSAWSPAQGGERAKPYPLISIHVKGTSRFKPEQIVAASGLKVGQLAREADFRQASDRLGETGLFTKVAYSYEYSPAGCRLELQVEENDNLVPVLFDNFVWFSDEELKRRLAAQLPLFEGRLPVGGKLGEELATALGAILRAGGIPGEIDYLPEASLNGPIESYRYAVKFHPILVRQIDFPGASPAEAMALEAAAQPLLKQDYLRTKLEIAEQTSFHKVYLARGYLKAKFGDAQVKIAQDGPETLVDVTIPVAPGLQYKLASFSFIDNLLVPTGQLEKLIQQKPGEPANAVQLADDLERVRRLYGTKGYLFAQVEPTPELDDSSSTVSYRFKVKEGDLYRMGELRIDGIDAEAAKRISTQWQMKPGDPFDASYLERFFKLAYRDVGLDGSWNIVPKQSVSEQDKTVSVTLHFFPKG